MKSADKTNYLFSQRDLVALIVPLIVEQFLAVAVGMADTIMVAAAGESAVSSVSLVDTINVLLINIFSALATGGAVVCGQFIGKKERENACAAADQLMLFTVVFSLAVMILIYILKGWILTTVFGKIEPDVMAGANTYIMIVTASIPFIAIYNSGAALFRTMGNSNISMITSFLMNGINIVGNAIMIYGMKLGVVGAAVPTLVSRIVAAAVIYILALNPKFIISLSKRPTFRPDFRYVRKILYIGVPNGLEGSMFQLGKIMVLSLVSTFGTSAIAANAVANNIATFQTLPGIAVGLALVTVVSRCVGASDYKQARYYTRRLIAAAYIGIIIMNIAIYLLLPTFLRGYNLSPETYSSAHKILLYHGLMSMIIWPLAFSLGNTMRAANDVKFTMISAILSMWIFRIFFSYVIGKYMGLGVFGVWVAMTIDWAVRAVCFVCRYLGHKWELHKI